jgi:hypothetical protein
MRNTYTTMVMAALLSACAADGGQETPGDEILPAGQEADQPFQLGERSAALIGPNDVGVLKEAGGFCPAGSEQIRLGFDNEDDNNNNQRSGWVGATSGGRNTDMFFCRVDGRSFRQRAGNDASGNYAVLQLGNTCPAGSVSFTRYFDNEDDPFTNGIYEPQVCKTGAFWSDGDISPSAYGGNCYNNLWMRFCMFRASTGGSSSPWPDVGVSYGVFSGSNNAGGRATGNVYTDDEDDNNNNSISGDFSGSEAFLTRGSNTRMFMMRVR